MSITIHPAINVPEGDGVTVKRLMPRHGLRNYDPFLQADMIPEVQQDGVTIRTIVGADGAINLYTDVEYLDVQIQSGSSFDHSVAAGAAGFIYAVGGSVEINGVILEPEQAACVDGISGILILSAQASRLMWCFGSPHHEPIHQHGPFVD